jgi:uncharacterized protein YbaR (Trm112 family)
LAPFTPRAEPPEPALQSLFNPRIFAGMHPKKGKTMPINKELLDILVCPLSKAPLVLDGDTLVSTDKKTRRRYKIEDDIPNMLIEDAEELDTETWTEIMKKHGKA